LVRTPCTCYILPNSNTSNACKLLSLLSSYMSSQAMLESSKDEL